MATNDNPKPAAAGMPAAERDYSDLYPLRPCLDYEEKCHQADLFGRSILQPMVNATRDELRRLGLPTDLDQLDPWVGWHPWVGPKNLNPKIGECEGFHTKDGRPNPFLQPPPPEGDARTYRNYTRGRDAADALLALRQLKTAIRQEDVYAAVRHMATFARLSEGFINYARRGQQHEAGQVKGGAAPKLRAGIYEGTLTYLREAPSRTAREVWECFPSADSHDTVPEFAGFEVYRARDSERGEVLLQGSGPGPDAEVTYDTFRGYVKKARKELTTK